MYVPHFFKISPVDGPLVTSVSWHLEVPLRVNVGVRESFSVMVFRNRGPRVDIKFLGLVLSKFFLSRGCCQCPFAWHLLGGSVISLLSPPFTVCRQSRWLFCQMGFNFLLSSFFFFFLRIKLNLIWPSLSYWGKFEIFQTCLFKRTPTGKDSMFQQYFCFPPNKNYKNRRENTEILFHMVLQVVLLRQKADGPFQGKQFEFIPCGQKLQDNGERRPGSAQIKDKRPHISHSRSQGDLPDQKASWRSKEG